MNFKLVLKTYSMLRQLTDDETALLNTLRGMTDAERELLAETLQPEKVVKAPTKERKIEKCEVCNFTRRAARHQSVIDPNYHEFVKPEKKSARASSLKEKIQGTSGSKVRGFTEDESDARCIYEEDADGPCGKLQDDPAHDTRYLSAHPFQPSTIAPPATRPSAANGGGEIEATVAASGD